MRGSYVRRLRAANADAGAGIPYLGAVNLLPFHRLLITVAIAFCLGFALWLIVHEPPTVFDAILATAFVVAGGALTYYLFRLRHFLGMDRDDSSR